eukprot:TRINITY_DN3598_c0_g1_i2.p1 TRINITY_DN3598_c0_g1~~TRINITY_DN3598_c0_g1_i2.p1  ORF type:complete len:254 (+),score=46.42 TRINITY_DN3598_c0_g1_i2:65-826(+)
MCIRDRYQRRVHGNTLKQTYTKIKKQPKQKKKMYNTYYDDEDCFPPYPNHFVCLVPSSPAPHGLVALDPYEMGEVEIAFEIDPGFEMLGSVVMDLPSELKERRAPKEYSFPYPSVCRFHSSGCKFGSFCRFAHPGDAKISNAEECVICQEDMEKSQKYYGLLTNCQHVFCYNCILKWRAEEDEEGCEERRRRCPVCRTYSPDVIPSLRFYRDLSDKEFYIKNYYITKASVLCEYVATGRPCPWDKVCLFSHEA